MHSVHTRAEHSNETIASDTNRLLLRMDTAPPFLLVAVVCLSELLVRAFAPEMLVILGYGVVVAGNNAVLTLLPELPYIS